MPAFKPQLGLIIAYKYIHYDTYLNKKAEHETRYRGQKNAPPLEVDAKEKRPCMIVGIQDMPNGEQRVTVVPISHEGPRPLDDKKERANYIEVPEKMKRHTPNSTAPLDNGDGWAKANEGNVFTWSKSQHVEKTRDGRELYGPCNSSEFWQKTNAQHHAASKGRILDRDKIGAGREDQTPAQPEKGPDSGPAPDGAGKSPGPDKGPGPGEGPGGAAKRPTMTLANKGKPDAPADGTKSMAEDGPQGHDLDHINAGNAGDEQSSAEGREGEGREPEEPDNQVAGTDPIDAEGDEPEIGRTVGENSQQIEGEQLDEPTEAADQDIDQGEDHIPAAGLEPPISEDDPDRVEYDHSIKTPDELEPNEPDTTQRPSAPIPGGPPALRPGSGGGESMWNDPGAVKSHIHYLENVAPVEREAQRQAEEQQQREGEDRQARAEAERIEHDRAGDNLSPEDRERYMGEAEPDARDAETTPPDPDAERQAEYRARGEAAAAQHRAAMADKSQEQNPGQAKGQDNQPAEAKEPAVAPADPEAARQAEYRARGEAAAAQHRAAMQEKEKSQAEGPGHEQAKEQDIDR